jgi:hypothetical protein
MKTKKNIFLKKVNCPIHEVSDRSYFANKYHIGCDAIKLPRRPNHQPNFFRIEKLAEELEAVNPTIAISGEFICLVADNFLAIKDLKERFSYHKKNSPKSISLAIKENVIPITFGC